MENSNINEKIKNISDLLPNLKINDCKFLNIGANSEAFLINNEFIFRFPLKPSVCEDYKSEQKILSLVSPHIKSTKVPKIEIFNNDKVFFSKHKIINGADFYKSELNILSKEKIAKQLARFFWELHSIDVNEFDFLKNKNFNLDKYDVSDKIDELKEILGYNFADDNIPKKIDYLYECQNNFNKTDNVLCHGDVHEENIIIDNNSLSGVIDFGNVFIDDRNIDFSSLLEYDVNFGLWVIKEYEKLANKKLNIKYIFYLQQFRCYSNLLYFIESGNEKYGKMFKIYVEKLSKAETFLDDFE